MIESAAGLPAAMNRANRGGLRRTPCAAGDGVFDGANGRGGPRCVRLRRGPRNSEVGTAPAEGRGSVRRRIVERRPLRLRRSRTRRDLRSGHGRRRRPSHRRMWLGSRSHGRVSRGRRGGTRGCGGSRAVRRRLLVLVVRVGRGLRQSDGLERLRRSDGGRAENQRRRHDAGQQNISCSAHELCPPGSAANRSPPVRS